MLELRCDDILQVSRFTQDQQNSLKQKTMFQWFLSADTLFKKHCYPMILAVLEEGIDKEQEWCDYILRNKHRYIIELHGREHIYYSNLSKEELYRDLYFARQRIEDTFLVKVVTWYVPFGRKGRNIYAEEVCKDLGLKLGIPNGKVDAKLWFHNKKMLHCNFHYWKDNQVRYVEKILEEINR